MNADYELSDVQRFAMAVVFGEFEGAKTFDWDTGRWKDRHENP